MDFDGFRKRETGLPMSSEKFAIKVENVSKVFNIYEKPQDRLKQAILPRIQRHLGLRSRSYHTQYSALSNISLEIKKGETLGIVGQNGAGKSTLLQIICGTLSPTLGKVHTSGRVAALLELGSGFNPEFTGRDNVYMNAAILGLSREEIDSKFESIINFADIGDFLDQPVKTYSSGMTLRLAFSVIAHVDADILIVDEALAVGDAFFTQKCMRFLRSFMEHGTVLFVSHDTGAVVNLCDRAILLKGGQIHQAGTPKDIIKNYLEMSYDSSSNTIANGSKSIENESSALLDVEYVDSRTELINNSRFRNDIEVFAFDPHSEGFGIGGAKIISTALLTENGEPASWLIGGEIVTLKVICEANENIVAPIIGFILKDRLGQMVFGDNTFLTYQSAQISVKAKQQFTAFFEFRLPLLPTGDYSISVAIAEGTQENHVQHEWLHDALLIKVHASSIVFGIVGVPMKKIELALTS